MLCKSITKIQEKGGAHGGIRLGILCFELGFVWLIYFCFGLAAKYDMPVWLTTTLIIVVDRLVSFITSHADARRRRLADRQREG